MATKIQNFDTQHWVKTRSSLDPNQSTFLVWSGAIYAFIPGEKKNCLFKMIGQMHSHKRGELGFHLSRIDLLPSSKNR